VVGRTMAARSALAWQNPAWGRSTMATSGWPTAPWHASSTSLPWGKHRDSTLLCARCRQTARRRPSGGHDLHDRADAHRGLSRQDHQREHAGDWQHADAAGGRHGWPADDRERHQRW